MRKPLAIFILILLISAFAVTYAQTTTISTAETFSISALDSPIRFSTEVNCKSANFENNTWFFTGLSSNKAGVRIEGNLHFSAQNCSIVIFYLQSWSQPESHYSAVDMQWIKYNVIGKGIQTLDANDLFPNSVNYTQWTVKINGEIKQLGDDWNYSVSKQLTITTSGQESSVEISVYHVPVGSDLAPLPPPEPALKNFSSTDRFQILSSNGTINFAVNGSYDNASLENQMWNFINLTLNNFTINAGVFAPNVTGRNVLPYILQVGYPANLGISVQNCNITITDINPLTWASYTPGLSYTVQGNGSQLFNFPFKLTAFNLTVFVDGVPKSNNDSWFLTSDNQLKIIGASSNVTVFGEAIPVESPPVTFNPLVSYQTLVVAIAGTAVFLTIVIVIMMRRRQRARANCLILFQNSSEQHFMAGEHRHPSILRTLYEAEGSH